jgi:hypothetical protein
MIDKLKSCLAVAEVQWVHCYLSIDRKTQIALFDAPDAHTVQTAHRMLGVPFVRTLPLEQRF